MFRYFIAIYMAVFFAVGPWLCCCAARAQTSEIVVTANEISNCCHAHHEHAGKRSDSHGHGDGSPSQERGHCPCSHGAVPAVLVPGAEKADVAVNWATITADSMFVAVFSPYAIPQCATRYVREPSALGGRALLVSFCILRC